MNQPLGSDKGFELLCSGRLMNFTFLVRTGNLAAVMKILEMYYQHPELEVVRAALDYNAGTEIVEMRV